MNMPLSYLIGGGLTFGPMAYCMIEPRIVNDEPTFDPLSDNKIAEWIDENTQIGFSRQVGFNLFGMFIINLPDLERLVAELKSYLTEQDLLDGFLKDIERCKLRGIQLVQYYCF